MSNDYSFQTVASSTVQPRTSLMLVRGDHSDDQGVAVGPAASTMGRFVWEQWLRTQIASLQPPKGVETVTAWAVASMLATYADADGTHITVSADTVRRQLRIGKAKADRTLAWLEVIGVVAVTTRHGRSGPTKRALAMPTAGSARDDETVRDERTTQDDPLKTMLNGPVTSFERTSNQFEWTTQASPQPLDQEETRGTTRAARDPSPSAPAPEENPGPIDAWGQDTGSGLPDLDGPAPSERCRRHAGTPSDDPCRACGRARELAQRWRVRFLADRAAGERRAQAELRRQQIAACPLKCQDGYLLGRVCHHNPAQSATNSRGIAACRAALNRTGHRKEVIRDVS